MSLLDGVVGVKQVTTAEGDPVPTRGTLHVSGPGASVRDDSDAEETILSLSSLEGSVATSVTSEVLNAPVTTLDLEGQDIATVVRILISQSIAIHGIAAPTVDGSARKTLLALASAGRLELKHQSGSSPAGTRISAPGAASYFMLDGASIDVVYDGAASVWRVVA